VKTLNDLLKPSHQEGR